MKSTPEKDKIMEDLDEAYLWLGRAISDFSRVEEQVGNVYRACYTIENEALAMNCYLAVKDSSLRQTLTSRAVYVTLHSKAASDELFDEWAGLEGRASSLSKRRNKLAHGAVEATKDDLPKDHFEVYVQPYAHQEPYAYYSRKYLTLKGSEGGKAPSGVFSKADDRIPLVKIQDFTVECETLSRNLHDFSTKIRKLLLS